MTRRTLLVALFAAPAAFCRQAPKHPRTPDGPDAKGALYACDWETGVRLRVVDKFTRPGRLVHIILKG